jgi:hypothetical protein
MALIIKDRVRETTNTIGTGTVTLAGAVTGYQTFSSALSNNDTCYYTIAGTSSSEWEVGLGTYSTNTLARNTVLASSNGGSLVVFSSGTKDVFITYPAGKAVYEDANNNLLLASTVSVDSVNNFVGINAPGPNYVLEVVAPTGLGSNVASFYSSDNATYTSQVEGRLSSSETSWYFTYNGGNVNTLNIGADDNGSYVNGTNLVVSGMTSLSLTTLTSGSLTVNGGTALAPSLASITNTVVGATTGGARLDISTGGSSSAADAAVRFTNSTATAANWTIGCDGSDNKAWKIARGTALGTNDAIVLRNDNQNVGVGSTISYSNITAPLTVFGAAGFSLGTVGAPSISSRTDLNTGFWFPAADTIAASTNGAERIRITSAGDVGIGETVPDYKLDVNGTFGFTPGASVTPVDNGDVVFELTSNTTLTIKAKGSDGTVRSVALTLA